METLNSSETGNPTFAQTINLRHYWHVVLERRWLVLSAFLSVLLLSLFYLYRAPRIYEAAARIQIDREAENILNIKDVVSLDGREQDYLQTVYKNLQSRVLIEAVIKQLRLDKDPRYEKAAPKVADAVYEDISVSPLRLSRLVDVKVEHTNPRQAQRIANALVTLFVQQNLEQKIDRSSDAIVWLRTEAQNLEKQVRDGDTALQTYKEENQLLSVEEEQNVFLQALKQRRADYDAAKTEATTNAMIVKEIDTYLESGVSIDTIPVVGDDELVKAMKKTLFDKQAALANLLKRYKDKHPEVIQARQEIASVETSIANEARRIVEQVRIRAQLARAKEQTLLAALQQQEQEQRDLSEKMLKLNYLVQEVNQNHVLYGNVVTRMKETEVSAKITANNMRMVDPAVIPVNPVKPKKLLVIGFGTMAGLVIALSLAFFVNYLDDSIKGQDDVETYLGLPFLGYIPHIDMQNELEGDLIAHLEPTSSASEGFRTVRAAVSLNNLPEKLRTIIVTSTVPSEGKSLVASNLAIVTAQAGLKTLLVETDLRRPSVHKTFKLYSPLGVSGYLLNKVDHVEEIAHKTDIPNLDVICCGPIPNNPSELIGSNRMVKFFEEARKRYDRVILDCSPVSAVSDPLVVASMADGLIFVMKFNKIRREHARKTIQRIQNAGIQILGGVINNIDFDGLDSYYYSHYYYQNRYYASHYKKNTEEAYKITSS
jgi:polysaccharide biosynthesis transport protein